MPLAAAIFLCVRFDRTFAQLHGNDGFQFIEHGVWIRCFNVEYFVGVDGISITMVLLTALVSFVGVARQLQHRASSSRATSRCSCCSRPA